jgi:GT2 family glycosyltransferase
MGAFLSNGIDFTIIVPTRDRNAQLRTCLEALAALRYPRSRFEVVVVDDGSREPVEPVVDRLRGRIQIRVLCQPGSGPASARNAGAACARGRFLAFTDDDCAPDPAWLERLAECFADAPDAVAGGKTVNQIEDNVFAAASQTLVSYLYDYFNNDGGRAWFLASCNFALAAKSFRAVGGFDHSYPAAAGEDRDICDRLRLQGRRMAYASDAVVYHRHTLTAAGFWNQHFGYGRGARRYRRAHRKRSGSGVRIEPPGFYWNLIVWPFRRDDLRAPLAVSSLLVLSQVANVAGFLWEWVNEKVGQTMLSVRCGIDHRS